MLNAYVCSCCRHVYIRVMWKTEGKTICLALRFVCFFLSIEFSCTILHHYEFKPFAILNSERLKLILFNSAKLYTEIGCLRIPPEVPQGFRQCPICKLCHFLNRIVQVAVNPVIVHSYHSIAKNRQVDFFLTG